MTTFDQYPLLKKAYAEQEGLARFVGSTVSEPYTQLIERCVELVETYIDRPQDEKEGLMVACVLCTSPPYIFDDITRFETEYTPQIKDIVDQIVGGEDPASHVDFLQALMVINTAVAEDLLEKLHANDVPDQETLGLIKEALKPQKQTPAASLLQDTAPRLSAYDQFLKAEIKTTLQFIADTAPAAVKKAQPPKPPGF